MKKYCNTILVLALLATTSCTRKVVPDSKASLLIALQTNDSKWSITLSVINSGRGPASVYRPFFHTTQLHIQKPDRSSAEIADQGEGMDLACFLGPGSMTNWFTDLRDFSTFDQTGEY